MYYDAFNQREIRESGIYRVEGIGHDFMVGTLDFSVIDEVLEVSDKDSFLTARQLARREGIFSGGSAGTAVHGALDVARRLGPGKTVVVIIPDSGDRYLSKCYDDEWMRDMGFLGPEQRLGTVRELLEFKPGNIEFARGDETIAEVAKRMADLGISQMPIHASDVREPMMIIHEVDMLQSMVRGECTADSDVLQAAKPMHGMVELDDSLAKVQAVFDDENVAMVIEDAHIVGVISKIDMVEFLAARS